MQAIILAAGMGKRLGDLTKDNTKCMVKVNGVPLIDRLLTQLSRFSLVKVIIVIGYEGKKLRDYIGQEYKGLAIEYIENSIYNTTNNIYSLSLAKQQLQEDDTLLIESDLIFEDSLFDMILNSPDPNVALVDKYETWMDGTMVHLDEENNIVNFVPKKTFKYSDVSSYYKTVNVYKFSKEFSRSKYVPFLEAYSIAWGNNEYYEQVLRVITLLDNTDLKALPLTGEKWYEIDDVQDLDIAETLFADSSGKLSLYQKRFGGYWRFPGLLDFCYLVNPYFPSRKMREEMKANFDTLLTEYPSGMGVNSLLASKYFGVKKEYICVGNGAAELIKSLMSYLDGNLGVIYPTFEEYPNRRESRTIISYIPDNTDFSYTVEDIQLYFEHKDISSLLLVNPDNPSGNFISKTDLLELAFWAKRRNIHLIVDESFVDFAMDGLNSSLLYNELLESYPNLIVMKSISKSYGVPGLRLGVLATSDIELISWMKTNVAIWNINSFAEFYMQIFGKYESDYKMACEKFVAERSRFFKSLQRISFLRVIPSQANYFLCEVTNKYTSSELTRILLCENDILIKDCGTKKAFGGRNYIRIAVRGKEENNKLVEVLLSL
ncbi:aminotransferase class I/II-fold pyridoxal phosphate-dependent enzyme [Bacteroides fragilis]|uniref:aminotransferase class I/II-fold pyridoxal phosphate-dependent enzyme n=1 Tax=Bacteroides fragilis TaxID=817 RepID=UPI001C247008|nr:aminotransferase class I/II-fold pyridoxal phosphate-dependent enzyme [Bacteroides fragilis]MBU9020388.1 aminotransferase class I/II-fold pyridoxal phosphate-dependent enzyme [Bacteroides fragilis]MBU9024834.1 aminotransferase class I/II-fold pyridoxal phosphate-dependent enzyme [Bacteroides fragilis]MBU9085331.1 aminotransferase class I/II-fold pyridoxal phosphate-dependent enzyme [Bacteroides fragilis]